MTTLTSRIRRVSAATLTLSALVLAGCAAGGSQPAPSESGANSEGFPVTVDTANGPVTVDEKPERIVVLGDLVSLDILNALGSPATVFSTGWQEDELLTSLSPWIEGMYQEFDPSLVSEWTGVPEAIAAREPDLVVGDGYFMLPDDVRAQVETVAPIFVIDQSEDWRVNLATLGELTGSADKATEVLASAEETLTNAKDRIPGLQGASYSVAYYSTEEAWMPSVHSILDEIGMERAESQPPAGAEIQSLALENLEQLNGDVVLLRAEGEDRVAADADPRIAQLPSARNGTLVWMDWALSGAVMPAPTSIEYALDAIMPQLEASALNQGTTP